VSLGKEQEFLVVSQFEIAYFPQGYAALKA